ncbi:MAG: HAD-IIB family hydrolase [Gammaproteobacteria bacterium]|jgi:mannosyl-3-phosphoglycerate phosphatase
MSTRYLVFTDLDGTLLDHESYDHRPASAALAELAARGIPVIPNTSKTIDEVLEWRRRLKLDGPFIVENGSALLLPDDRADWRVDPATSVRDDRGFYGVIFGATIATIKARLTELDAAGRYDYAAFSQMDIAAITAATGLDAAAAAQAQARRFSEPLLWRDDEAALVRFAAEVATLGLRATRGGRFVHVIGDTDKGIALERTTRLYTPPGGGNITTIALGDSPNDAAMLAAADIAIVVSNPHASGPALEQGASLYTTAAGPAGWQEAFDELFRSRITATKSPGIRKA